MRWTHWLAVASVVALAGVVAAAPLSTLHRLGQSGRGVLTSEVTQSLSPKEIPVVQFAARRIADGASGMRKVIVTNRDDLYGALKTAQAGDVIELAPGNYGSIALKNLKFAQDVVVRSLDSGNQAVLTGLDVSQSAGLVFQNLELDVTAQPSNSVKITTSERITIQGSWIHGSLDGTPMGDPSGMTIRESRHITVVDSKFEQLFNALSFLDGEHYTFSGNTFRDLRVDAIRGGGASHVTVKNNFFTDFYPVKGDHGDAIQFWTAKTTASATDIVITGNVYLRGEGLPVQGIFIKDDSGGKYPYVDIKISDNLIVGSLWNGITLEHATGGEITGNKVLSMPGQNARIRVASDVLLSNNEAPQYLIDGKASRWDGSKQVTDGGAAALKAWWATVGSSLQGVPEALMSAAGVDVGYKAPVAPSPQSSAPTPSTPAVAQGGAGGQDSSAGGSAVQPAMPSSLSSGTGDAPTIPARAHEVEVIEVALCYSVPHEVPSTKATDFSPVPIQGEAPYVAWAPPVSVASVLGTTSTEVADTTKPSEASAAAAEQPAPSDRQSDQIASSEASGNPGSTAYAEAHVLERGNPAGMTDANSSAAAAHRDLPEVSSSWANSQFARIAEVYAADFGSDAPSKDSEFWLLGRHAPDGWLMA